MSAKNAEIRRRVLSKLENEPDLTLQKLAKDRQRIPSIRKVSKNIEESDVANVRKIKHRSLNHDYSKKYDYPKFQCRQTSDNPKINNPELATAVENYIGPRTVPIVQKKRSKLQ